MENAKRLSKKSIIIGITLLVALAAAFTAIYFIALDPPAAGAKEITVEIVHSDKTVKTVDISTDAQYLRQALEEKSLIQGTESSMGIMITAADGEKADDSKQEWWRLTQNGEYLNTGADTTPIKDGDKFELTFTVGW